MRKNKLSLSVDETVVSRAKQYARDHGVSISEVVENYLKAIAEPASAPQADPPVLRALRGKLKPANPEDYGRHLVEKYK